MADDLHDPQLGHLVWDEEMDWWISEVELRPGYPIEVIVEYHEESDEREVVLSQARSWLTRVRQREPEYRRWAAEQLLDRRWNTDERMSAEDLVDLLRAHSVVCAADGTASVYWDDDDVLFSGHGLYTQLGADGECIEVRMQ
jgi:hypothetical protein